MGDAARQRAETSAKGSLAGEEEDRLEMMQPKDERGGTIIRTLPAYQEVGCGFQGTCTAMGDNLK
jgi:hypothetical protein